MGRVIVLVSLVVVLVVGGMIAFKAHEKSVRRQAAIDEAATAYKAASAARAEFDAERKRFAEMAGRWNDSMQIVTRSSRIALAQPMINMQALLREMRAAKFTTCIKDAHESLVEGAEILYQDMLNFMSDSSSAIVHDGDIASKTEAAKNLTIDCDAKTQANVDAAKRNAEQVAAAPPI